MKNEDCPHEVRPLFKLMEQLIPKYHLYTVWDDFLTILLAQFNLPEHLGNEHFLTIEKDFHHRLNRYTPGERKVFGLLVHEYFNIMLYQVARHHYKLFKDDSLRIPQITCASIYEEQLDTTYWQDARGTTYIGNWYDALGDLYMALNGAYKEKRLGQFFTPIDISNLLTNLVGCSTDKGVDEFGQPYSCNNRRHVNEPTCGSGRIALSMHVQHPGTMFFVLQDIDPICCKMAAINCLMHGLPAEIICGNTLNPDDYQFGYKCNRWLYSRLAPAPHVAQTPHFWLLPEKDSYHRQFWDHNSRRHQTAFAAYFLPARMKKKHRLRQARQQVVGTERPYLNSFLKGFTPLLQRHDPIQLWTNILDMMIGSFQAVTALDTPIPISEGHSQRDYERAVLALGADPATKEQVNQLIIDITRIVARHNSAGEKYADDWHAHVVYCYKSMYDQVSTPRWFDFFGEMHYWLEERYPRASMRPCAAPVAQTEQWAKAQLANLPLFHEGKPISIDNRLHSANMDCGSGRTTLAFQAARPGCFEFSCESTDLLHCKYTVLNMLLHGVYGQVSHVDTNNRTKHLRTWDVNRWLFAVDAPHPAYAQLPHVFDAPKEMSQSYRHWNDREGISKPHAADHLQDMQADMLNRLIQGLGMQLSVKMTGDTMFIGERNQIAAAIEQHPAPARPAPATSNGGLKRRLFAKLQEQQHKTPLIPTPIPVIVEPPAEPKVAVKRGWGARRRE